MKLHHVAGSRSNRIRWLLEELGMGYELEVHSLADGSLKSEAYLAMNPLGLVPTLEDGEVTIFESGAIVQYLLERYGAGRLEPGVNDPTRPAYLQWLHWAEATLMPPLADIMRHRFFAPEAQGSETAVVGARKRFASVLTVLAARVDEQPFVAGPEFTAADVMMAYGPFLARLVGELPEEPKALHAYLERVSVRPAFARAFAPSGDA